MRSKSEVFFWPAAVVTMALVGAFIVHGMKGRHAAPAHQAGYAEDKPRNELPLDEYTPLYARMRFPVMHPDGSGYRMTFFWHQPEQPWPQGAKFPLVLVMHGSGGSAYAGKYLIEKQNRADFPAFILVPALPPEKTWAYPARFPEYPEGAKAPRGVIPLASRAQEMGDIVDLIGALAVKYPIDTGRIYAVGCSEGGLGVFGAARYYPGVFAAGIAISGGWTAEEAGALTQTPLLVIHGSDDRNVPVALSRNIAAAVNRLGGKITYVERAGMGHECPSPDLYARAVWGWLFSHRKEPAAAAP